MEFIPMAALLFLNLLLYLVEKYYDRKTAIFCSKIISRLRWTGNGPIRFYNIYRSKDAWG